MVCPVKGSVAIWGVVSDFGVCLFGLCFPVTAESLVVPAPRLVSTLQKACKSESGGMEFVEGALFSDHFGLRDKKSATKQHYVFL